MAGTWTKLKSQRTKSFSKKFFCNFRSFSSWNVKCHDSQMRLGCYGTKVDYPISLCFADRSIFYIYIFKPGFSMLAAMWIPRNRPYMCYSMNISLCGKLLVPKSDFGCSWHDGKYYWPTSLLKQHEFVCLHCKHTQQLLLCGLSVYMSQPQVAVTLVKPRITSVEAEKHVSTSANT